ncbi:MAG: molybdopterin-dependent oxidoreductase, partial [Xanthobacteraceae bacterium]
IHGMVRQPLEFTLESLSRYPLVTRMAFVECAGNSAPMFSSEPMQVTAQAIHGPRASSVGSNHANVPLLSGVSRTWGGRRSPQLMRSPANFHRVCSVQQLTTFVCHRIMTVARALKGHD